MLPREIHLQMLSPNVLLNTTLQELESMSIDKHGQMHRKLYKLQALIKRVQGTGLGPFFFYT